MKHNNTGERVIRLSNGNIEEAEGELEEDDGLSRSSEDDEHDEHEDEDEGIDGASANEEDEEEEEDALHKTEITSTDEDETEDEAINIASSEQSTDSGDDEVQSITSESPRAINVEEEEAEISINDIDTEDELYSMDQFRTSPLIMHVTGSDIYDGRPGSLHMQSDTRTGYDHTKWMTLEHAEHFSQQNEEEDSLPVPLGFGTHYNTVY
jgi:hypothetical protein